MSAVLVTTGDNGAPSPGRLCVVFDFCKRRFLHSILDEKTPDTAYFNLTRPPLVMDA